MRFKLKYIRRATLAAFAAACAIGLLAACGSSGSSTATNASASASGTTSTSTTPSASGFRERIAKLRKCLQENGVTLPQGKPGTPGQGLRAFQLPKGMTRTQYDAVLKKCGGGLGGLGGRFAGGRRGKLRNSPQFKAALAKFSTCMSENGIKLPQANASGNGPIFNTKGVNTTTPQFKAALAKCRPALSKVLPVVPGAGAGAEPGAPPSVG